MKLNMARLCLSCDEIYEVVHTSKIEKVGDRTMEMGIVIRECPSCGCPTFLILCTVLNRKEVVKDDSETYEGTW